MKSVCVLLSAYNNEAFIEEQVDSILSQESIQVYLCVRIDGASDRTSTILHQKYGSRSNVDIQVGDNLGPADSFLELLYSCKIESEFYAFADADDVWHPRKLLESAVRLSKLSHGPAAVVVQQQLVDKNLNHIRWTSRPNRGYKFENAIVQTAFPGNSALFNREAFRLLTVQRPSYVAMHDSWIYLVISAFGVIEFIELPLIQYRQHGENVFGVDDSFIGRNRQRLRRLKGTKYDFHLQAQEFLRIYASRLSSDKLAILNRYTDYRKTRLKTLGCAINPPFVMQSTLSQIYTCFLALARKI